MLKTIIVEDEPNNKGKPIYIVLIGKSRATLFCIINNLKQEYSIVISRGQKTIVMKTKKNKTSLYLKSI